MNKNNLFALMAGFVFGIGLILAGMVNPAKVIGFLDISAAWDPSLAFVMLGAIAVGTIAFAIAKKRTLSLLGTPMQIPTSRTIDKPLVLGSLTFGIGWGLAGICPGPAIVLLGTGSLKGLIFVLAMLGGMAVYELLEAHRLRKAQ
jgi:hypothetical protein